MTAVSADAGTKRWRLYVSQSYRETGRGEEEDIITRVSKRGRKEWREKGGKERREGGREG